MSSSINVKNVIKTHAIMSLGVLCTAIGWGVFLVPAKVVGGGVSGIAALIYYSTGISVGISSFVINAILILLAMKIVNVPMALRSLYGVILFSFLFGLIQSFFPEPIIQDTLLAAIVGGGLSGLGVGIVYTQGGSTGGTDLVTAMVMAHKNISPGKMLTLVDALVVTSSYFIVQDLERMIYGYCVLAIAGYVVDFVLAGNKQSYQLFIFSSKYEQVAEHVFTNVKRGITLVDAQGWYTRKPTKMLMIIVRKHEVSQVFRCVKEIDPDAFISMGNVMGVYGKGFDRMRS